MNHADSRGPLNISLNTLRTTAFASKAAEAFFLACLQRVYGSQFDKSWLQSSEAPHFYSQHWNVFRMLNGKATGPGWLLRGVYAYEVINQGAKVLDIGCGDGFFTKNFLAPKALRVDAIDIEPSAIDEARRRNADPRIRYERRDAISETFPDYQYDTVVWDGAIGHFTRQTSEVVLRKISAGLNKNGVFCGSETLGTEGSDHLQYFMELSDLGKLLASAFESIWLKVDAYPINNGFLRREAYWRCSPSATAVGELNWTKFDT
jgi:2-polyprenyl-3-methyl-5-hydroxy-6-metoxy-1,4-benzoquinol methylase